MYSAGPILYMDHVDPTSCLSLGVTHGSSITRQPGAPPLGTFIRGLGHAKPHTNSSPRNKSPGASIFLKKISESIARLASMKNSAQVTKFSPSAVGFRGGLRVGIDVGGTHTDAVLLDGDAVLASVKALATRDAGSGILAALETILGQNPGIEEKVDAVMLGTTQFTNAVIERRELAEVAAVRIGLPSGRGIPPKTGWPEDISRSLGEHVYPLHGGYLYDGWPLAELDEKEIRALIRDLRMKKVEAVAIASAFSPMNPQPEQVLAERIRAELPAIRITESHTIGRLGLLERENAAMLNAALLEFAARVVDSFESAIRERGLNSRFYISQNDGSLMDAEFARRFPALTFASGPTNSLRGACRLTGLNDAIVVDIGGTTSDIGILRDSFPRESNIAIEVGGVRTNFRMPDILSIGLGGGSLVGDDGCRVGPRSVGRELLAKGMVFGGDCLTATDIVVAAGQAGIGDPEKVRGLGADVVSSAKAEIARMLNAGIEQMKPGGEPVPVVLVGGGAILATEQFAAASEILLPEYSGVANAIGAAIAQVGGEAESMISYAKIPRREAIARLSRKARQAARSAGADPATVRVADIEETAISYMPGNVVRLRVKVVGDASPQPEGRARRPAGANRRL